MSDFHDFARSLIETQDAALLDAEGGLALQWAQSLEQKVDSITDTVEQEELRLESHTWRLVQVLYAERLDDIDRTAYASTSKNPYLPPNSLVQRLVLADQDLSELQAIVTWLYDVAEAPAVDPRRGYQPHTRLMIKQAARTRSKQPPGTVSELDPDATIRETARWADEDEFYESTFLRFLFQLVRAGEFDTALDLCRQSDQSWRAASLAGIRFWKDSRYADEDQDMMDNQKASEGNVRRQLYKRTARKIAQNSSLKLYERALYGYLCGHVDAVLPACETWEDELWAHANALLQSELDARISGAEDGRYWLDGSNVAAEHRINAPIKVALQEVFERLQESQNARTRSAASHPLRIAQRYLVLGQIDRLFDEFTVRLEHDAASVSETELARLIRFFAHLALYLRRTGLTTPASANDVLEAYARVLETHGVNNLVAYYASHLRADEAIETFALYLQRSHPLLESREARYGQLVRAQEHKLDVADVARRTVELILADAIANAPDISNENLFSSSVRPSELDFELIRSIEWLSFLEETYIDALRQANALTRYFLASGKPSAAREVLISLPDKLPAYVAAKSSNRADPLASLLTEYSDYRLLFTCLQSYAVWSDVWSRRPAKKPSRLAAQDYAALIGKQCTEFYDTVIDLLHLKWLHRDDDTLDEVHGMNAIGRLHELSIVRQIYIPELVFRLHRVLMETHAYVPATLQSAIDLVQIVADERLQIWREFIGATPDSNRLPDLLERIRESSLAALATSTSPFTIQASAE